MKLLLVIGLLVSSQAFAAMRQYAAPVESSDWQVVESSRLQCTLGHTLPGYGDALFTSVASKQLNMEFELDMHLLPKKFEVAAVYSVPPRWMPGQAPKPIADMTLRTQYNGDLPEKAAWTMLSELGDGGMWRRPIRPSPRRGLTLSHCTNLLRANGSTVSGPRRWLEP